MSNLPELPEYAARNREYWDAHAPEWIDAGERNWASPEPTWGMWGIPESELHMLEGVAGKDAVELGCGTGYISAWLARLGARPVGIDNSAKQLETARRLQTQHGLDFPLIHSLAEAVPYPDASFDFAISEYGAAIWSDPYTWIPEAHRVLRPDTEDPAAEQLINPQFGKYRYEWSSDNSVEFHLPHGEMIRLLRDTGFEIEELTEIQAPEGTTTRHTYITPEWARKWPSEEVWKARKRV